MRLNDVGDVIGIKPASPDSLIDAIAVGEVHPERVGYGSPP